MDGEEKRFFYFKLVYKNWGVFASQMFDQIYLNIRANLIFLAYSKIIVYIYEKLNFGKIIVFNFIRKNKK